MSDKKESPARLHNSMLKQHVRPAVWEEIKALAKNNEPLCEYFPTPNAIPQGDEQ